MADMVQTEFGKMGARVKVKAGDAGPIRVDVRRDNMGEYFEVRHGAEVAVRVLEVTPTDRHLVLRARMGAGRNGRRRARTVDRTFLCGRDENKWFVAAVPEAASASTVQGAKDALKPREVWDSIRAHNVPPQRRDLRRNEAFLRQGEWFFLPRPALKVDPARVLEHEPLKRGDLSKPHDCRYGYRVGGIVVWVCNAYPNGLTHEERAKLPREERKGRVWNQMFRNPEFYAKGTVSHVDHKPIWLPCWHLVVMNRERDAAAMRNVAFLD